MPSTETYSKGGHAVHNQDHILEGHAYVPDYSTNVGAKYAIYVGPFAVVTCLLGYPTRNVIGYPTRDVTGRQPEVRFRSGRHQTTSDKEARKYSLHVIFLTQFWL